MLHCLSKSLHNRVKKSVDPDWINFVKLQAEKFLQTVLSWRIRYFVVACKNCYKRTPPITFLGYVNVLKYIHYQSIYHFQSLDKHELNIL